MAVVHNSLICRNIIDSHENLWHSQMIHDYWCQDDQIESNKYLALLTIKSVLSIVESIQWNPSNQSQPTNRCNVNGAPLKDHKSITIWSLCFLIEVCLRHFLCLVWVCELKVHADELYASNKQQKFIAISENDNTIFEYFGIKCTQNGIEWCVNHTKRTSIGWEKIGLNLHRKETSEWKGCKVVARQKSC